MSHHLELIIIQWCYEAKKNSCMLPWWIRSYFSKATESGGGGLGKLKSFAIFNNKAKEYTLYAES